MRMHAVCVTIIRIYEHVLVVTVIGTLPKALLHWFHCKTSVSQAI